MKNLLTVLILLALGACTDGSSGGGSLSDDESIDGFNGPLTGLIYLNKSVIYLETGARYRLVNLDGVGPVSATGDDRFIIGITPRCPDDNPENVSCIRVLDEGVFSYVTHFDRSLYPAAPVIDNDSQNIIFYDRENGRRKAYFVTNDFDLTTQGPDVTGIRESIQRATWGPDGSVYYTQNYGLYRIDSVDQPVEDDTLVWSFADASQGIPTDISVHPDGNVIAVSRFAADNGEGGQTDTIWRVNPAEGSAAPFITSTTYKAVRYPHWSRDGRYLIAAVNPSDGIYQGWIPGLQQGLVAFDASYSSHEVTITGPLTQTGRFEIRARCGQITSCDSSEDGAVGVEAAEIGAWIYPDD